MASIYNIDWVNIDGNHIHKTAVIDRNFVEIGTGNVIGPYTCIGTNGEIRGKDFRDFKGKVVIGNNNTISEHVTIQRPFDENAKTVIGSQNIIMAHTHIGHDVKIGSSCEICSGSIIGGHCIIHDHVKIKLGSVIRNRVKILCGALIGMGAVVIKDVDKLGIVYGNPAKKRVE